MNKLALLVVLVVGGVAVAAPDSQPSAPKKKCDPFSSMHACDDRVADNGSATKPSDNAGAPMPPPPVDDKVAPPPAGNRALMRQTCVDAMNADPTFAKSIVATIDKQLATKIDTAVEQAHLDADYHIQKNEKHVFYAYAAMWMVAALFVLFLWLRQQRLQAEIAMLRRDLEVAAKDGTAK